MLDLEKSFLELSEYAQKPATSADERIKILQQIKVMLINEKSSLEKAISDDFGYKPIAETRLFEISVSIECLRHSQVNLKYWMKSRKVGKNILFWPSHCSVVAQPLGVIGIIVPWNAPILLAIRGISSAIAAGNRVMIKMSELAPSTGKLLATLFEKYVDNKWIKVVNGDVSVSQYFSSLPFNHILFTGSTATGKKIMSQAAMNLVPVTLELGGKCPVLISKDINISEVCTKIIIGKSRGAGQVCISPDYVLCPSELMDSFVDTCVTTFNDIFPEFNTNKDYSSIINKHHFNRICSLLSDIPKEKIISSGDIDYDRSRIPLHIIINPLETTALMTEEIFGPLLPVIPYDSFDEAISIIHKQPNPLNMYYFGKNNIEKNYIINNILAGGICINATLFHYGVDDLPFGGVGASGIGQYHGKYGFDQFSKQKSIYKHSDFSMASLFKAPYKRWMFTLVNLMIKLRRYI